MRPYLVVVVSILLLPNQVRSVDAAPSEGPELVAALSSSTVESSAQAQQQRGQPAPPRPPARPVRRPRPTIWDSRWRVSVNAGLGVGPRSFVDTIASAVYVETAHFTTDYRVSSGMAVDAALLYRITGDFGIGIGVTQFSPSQTGTVTGAVPHPFFFGSPRSLTGDVSGLKHQELAAHIDALYILKIRKNLDIALMGGPSIFQVKQDLVSSVAFSDAYPYDTVSFTSAGTTSASATTLGINVGTDVTFRLAKRVGVGGILRFSRGSVDIRSGQKQSVGNVEAGGGLRLLF